MHSKIATKRFDAMSMNYRNNKSTKLITTTTTITMTITKRKNLVMLILPMVIIFMGDLCSNSNSAVSAQHLRAPAAPNELDELLEAESFIIDELKNYIKTTEKKIDNLKSKLTPIKTINSVALNDTDKYVNNPINAITMLKRFTTDWKQLRADASDVLVEQTYATITSSAMRSLNLPNDEDLDVAIGNLLRIQNLYNLATNSLAAGEIQGVKVGSAMSWSDCLEIGRTSDKRGDYAMAKYWLATALERLPSAAADNQNNATTSSTTPLQLNHKFEVLEALLATEYRHDNLAEALSIAKQMLALKPKHIGVVKAIATIEKEIKSNEKKQRKQQLKQKPRKHVKQTTKQPKIAQDNKVHKSAKQQLIEELCAGTSTNTNTDVLLDNEHATCAIVSYQLPALLLQPLHVEIVSIDPYIVIYHNALHVQQINQFNNQMATMDVPTTSKSPNELSADTTAKLTKYLQFITGHASGTMLGKWQLRRNNYKDALAMARGDETTDEMMNKDKRAYAGIMINLQSAIYGGNLIFPQLQLKVKLPQFALLYYTKRNEFNELDYRSRYEFCPVIAGTQIVATAAIEL